MLVSVKFPRCHRRKAAKRCVVGNCSNSAYGSEYTVYSIQQQVKEENTRKKWLDFVSKSRQNFDAKQAKTMYIYDGNFLEGDFCSHSRHDVQVRSSTVSESTGANHKRCSLDTEVTSSTFRDKGIRSFTSTSAG